MPKKAKILERVGDGFTDVLGTIVKNDKKFMKEDKKIKEKKDKKRGKKRNDS